MIIDKTSKTPLTKLSTLSIFGALLGAAVGLTGCGQGFSASSNPTG